MSRWVFQVRTVQTTHFARKILGCPSLFFPKDAVSSSFSKSQALFDKKSIRQVCVLSANSASTMLSTTSKALLNICQSYKDSLNVVISSLEMIKKSDCKYFLKLLLCHRISLIVSLCNKIGKTFLKII